MTNGNFRLSEASHFFGQSKWGNNKETNYTLLFTFLELNITVFEHNV